MSDLSDKFADFQELFFVARVEHSAYRRTSNDAAAYVTALEYAEVNRIPGGKILLKASLMDWQGKPEEALTLLSKHEGEIEPELFQIRDFVLAGSHYHAGQLDEAEKLLVQLTEKANSPLRNYALLNLANLYGKQGRYDEAIATAEDAARQHVFEIHERALLTAGRAFLHKGDNQRALECFRRVLKAPNGAYQGRAWFEIGKTLYHDHHFVEALEACEKALEFTDLGLLDRNAISTIRRLLSREMAMESLSSNDKALLDISGDPWSGYSPEQRIVSKIEAARQSQYEAYLQRPSSGTENIFSVLRGWSSAMTLLGGSESLWTGGGYLIKWQGIGIAIDPGFDFLRNLHDAGYHGREIDVVLVSHNHPDHNADLTRFDDLRYELYVRRGDDPHGGVKPYLLLWDSDSHSATRFSAERPQHQHRPIVFDLGRADPFDRIETPQGLPFSVEYFEVKHGDLRNAVGFRLALHSKSKNEPDFVIGYTGDTEFFPTLPDRLHDCDILLAHISQPDLAEFSDPTFRKSVHLGYRGLADLIRLSRPRLTLVGEFWAGLADLRIDLVAGLRRLSGTKGILPTGLGMQLALPSMHVKCSECGDGAPASRTNVAPPPVRYGRLSYLCSRCVLR